jgi:hypothetical protein|tara:strand:+ start:1679 stop:1864 length:186 start_codon:yes stop_codon:yes gene_type:complete
MEILFELSVGAWFGTAVAILELNVINPILERDYMFVKLMEDMQIRNEMHWVHEEGELNDYI